MNRLQRLLENNPRYQAIGVISCNWLGLFYAGRAILVSFDVYFSGPSGKRSTTLYTWRQALLRPTPAAQLGSSGAIPNSPVKARASGSLPSKPIPTSGFPYSPGRAVTGIMYSHPGMRTLFYMYQEDLGYLSV